MKKVFLAVLLAAAACRPGPDRTNVTLNVGDTEFVHVAAEGPGGYFDGPWFFASNDDSIIRVTGRMTEPWPPGVMRITGLRPGKATARIENESETLGQVAVTVRCGAEPPIQPAEPRQTMKTGDVIALRAVTSLADRTTFTWYLGRLGDASFPIHQAGPEIAFATKEPGEHHVWVMATTPCSTSTAQFVIDAMAPRRRTSRS